MEESSDPLALVHNWQVLLKTVNSVMIPQRFDSYLSIRSTHDSRPLRLPRAPITC